MKKLATLAALAGALTMAASSATFAAEHSMAKGDAQHEQQMKKPKAAEGKCGEGKCGAAEKTTKSAEGKCGEGKCGSK